MDVYFRYVSPIVLKSYDRTCTDVIKTDGIRCIGNNRNDEEAQQTQAKDGVSRTAPITNRNSNIGFPTHMSVHVPNERQGIDDSKNSSLPIPYLRSDEALLPVRFSYCSGIIWLGC
uniref:NR LBD domain-containing protein n=1 Tax=Caenorhabditis tropicalis TaxID=1561998 RepID=A0A1I7UET9_9PELO